MGGFDLKAAFPDLNPRFHHFRLDPLDAGRVWFTSVASGTDSGSGFLGGKPTGKAFRTPPQACSLKFNAEGKVVKYTIGHVMERSIGNTGGLGEGELILRCEEEAAATAENPNTPPSPSP